MQSDIEHVYHDTEWGRPLHDERRLFEMLVLEGVQAGLSWRTVLARRGHYRAAFDGFDIDRIAGYDLGRVERLLGDSGIIRNRAKIEAVVANARACVRMREAGEPFGAWMWAQVGGAPQLPEWRHPQDVPAKTAQSARISRDLRQRGFCFVGPVIVNSFLKATGMVNAHLQDCPRQAECRRAWIRWEASRHARFAPLAAQGSRPILGVSPQTDAPCFPIPLS
ncbi:MAG: DNA-3-methyladenine glycosylase I [Nevskiaceae bacterium]|nr:MAG: DNA-3-methyladenine glycosylase I [Nevskiaceae bacterium]TBR74471.1 MAG: DNA-3-methyladenine glycosylase I [Nevskiaceae bacterium]